MVWASPACALRTASRASPPLPLLGCQADFCSKGMEVPDQLPHNFAQAWGFALAEAGHYCAGNILGGSPGAQWFRQNSGSRLANRARPMFVSPCDSDR